MISIPAWAWHIHIKTHKYTSGDGGGPTALSECKREYVCIKTLTVCVEWTTCQTRYRGNFMFESVCVSACFGSQCGTHRVYYAWPKANHSDGNVDGTTQRECEWLSGECREHTKKKQVAAIKLSRMGERMKRNYIRFMQYTLASVSWQSTIILAIYTIQTTCENSRVEPAQIYLMNKIA